MTPQWTPPLLPAMGQMQYTPILGSPQPAGGRGATELSGSNRRGKTEDVGEDFPKLSPLERRGVGMLTLGVEWCAQPMPLLLPHHAPHMLLLAGRRVP